MKMQLKINKQFPPLTKMVKVKDDWYPCFENNTVKVSLMVLYAGWNDKYPYYIKFQAWGADDFGLEKEKLFTDFDQIEEAYNYYKEQYNAIPEIVDKNYFYNIGFVTF